MIGFVIILLVLSFLTGMILSCCICGRMSKNKHLQIQTNWPFMKLRERSQFLMREQVVVDDSHFNETEPETNQQQARSQLQLQ